MSFKLAVLIITIMIPISSQAVVISTSLPLFSGDYEYQNDLKGFTFDLGIEFSSIESASIELTAMGTRGTYSQCAVFTLCNRFYSFPKAVYGFVSEDPSIPEVSGSLVISTLNYETTNDFLSDTTHLLDGQATLFLDHKVVSTSPGYTDPFFHVSDLTLKIDGTVVPLLKWLY